VLLWYAEALNETGQTDKAYPYINEVRQRAGIGDLSPGLSQNDFRKAVWKEERLESPFEGHRWDQLRRTGRAVEVINSKVASGSTTVGATQPITKDNLLYPIPSSVITTDHIKQNPEY
jgi:hypothetical protein